MDSPKGTTSKGGGSLCSSNLSKWIQAAQNSKLLNQKPRAAAGRCPDEACGVSLHYLFEFSQRLESLLPREAETCSVVVRVVAPLANQGSRIPSVGGQCRLFDWVPSKFTKAPDVYVAHAWSQPFVEMVEQLTEHLCPGAASGDEIAVEKSRGLYVWLDVFAVCQSSPEGQPNIEYSLVRDALRLCSRGNCGELM
jgi:hypothetical protein